MRREGRIPHERYVHEWIECKDPSTGETHEDTVVCYKNTKVGSNHSKWDRQHLLCTKLYREKPAHKSLACHKGFKNKRGRKALVSAANPDEGVSDPTALVSLVARGIAEALDSEDCPIEEWPGNVLSAMEAQYEAEEAAWGEEEPRQYYQDLKSSAYERDFPPCTVESEAVTCAKPLIRDFENPLDENLQVYGSSPESAGGICIHFPKQAPLEAFPTNWEKAYEAYLADNFAPGSLIPAAKYADSHNPEQACNGFGDDSDGSFSDEEMDTSPDFLITESDPGMPEAEAHSLDHPGLFSEEKLKGKANVADKGAQPAGELTASDTGSVFGGYENVEEEEWDVISDEGSWEDQIFEDSDICTISVHYGAK